MTTPAADSPLDAGIAAYVHALIDGGVETFESCEGGAGVTGALLGLQRVYLPRERQTYVAELPQHRARVDLLAHSGRIGDDRLDQRGSFLGRPIRELEDAAEAITDLLFDAHARDPTGGSAD